MMLCACVAIAVVAVAALFATGLGLVIVSNIVTSGMEDD